MRKITAQAVQAFISWNNFKSGNTEVVVRDNTVTMYLHGNAIAKTDADGISVSCGGWTSNTTKERLNGLMQELDLGGIYQKDYVWYFDDGSEFDTCGWNLIKQR